MSITVYLYPKCTTCQKALNFLNARELTFSLKNIKETPPSLSELKKMLNFVGGDLKKLFNTSGLIYKELGLRETLPNMQESKALELLSLNGMLVKRPFLIGENIGLIGFKEAQWAADLKNI